MIKKALDLFKESPFETAIFTVKQHFLHPLR